MYFYIHHASHYLLLICKHVGGEEIVGQSIPNIDKLVGRGSIMVQNQEFIIPQVLYMDQIPHKGNFPTIVQVPVSSSALLQLVNSQCNSSRFPASNIPILNLQVLLSVLLGDCQIFMFTGLTYVMYSYSLYKLIIDALILVKK